VSRRRDAATGRYYETWRDAQTNLLWGDALDSRYSHRNAVEINGAAVREMACASTEGIRAGTEGQTFRLPSRAEFEQAERNGVREIAPHMANRFFWSSSLYPAYAELAFGFSGNNGGVDFGNRGNVSSVRCVAVSSTGQRVSSTGQRVSSTGQRVSSTGAVFTRDTSVPSLGEAYRDPAGLIWGSIVRLNGQVKTMSQYEADKYCKSLGARLPTKEEFERLARYLTAQKYSPYLVGADGDVLPGLTGYPFWSSSLNPRNGGGVNAFGFSGSSGGFLNVSPLFDYSVRCVAIR
jgi:formylglycine-generating enzyme required for sulfatase activity